MNYFFVFSRWDVDRVFEQKVVRSLLPLIVLVSIPLVVMSDEASVAPIISNVQSCIKGSYSVVVGNLLFRCLSKNKAWYWDSAPLNTSSVLAPSIADRVNFPTSPALLPQCSGR